MVLKAPKLPVNVNVPGAGLQALFDRGSSPEQPPDAPQNAFALKIDPESAKRSKEQAYYRPVGNNTPFKCKKCKFFQPVATAGREGGGSTSGPSKCQLVSSFQYPTPGQIHPEYGCSLWNATGPRLKATGFLWGKTSTEGGIAPQTIRYGIFKRVMARMMGKHPEGHPPPAGQTPYSQSPPAPRWRKNVPGRQKWDDNAGGMPDEFSSVD